ncbi:MAG TPA: isoprenylcysteine carboxylmethyltransferase family protein [Acidobacteriaceae bacterium]|nr:isoprenylcysteine carboxylmethyltransferase family protein [Acidobacteriaceae bacterium]
MASGWSKVARRIRVPLGFAFAAVFLWLARPGAESLALSLLVVAPGLWLRGYAAGYVKKNAEVTMTGPYAFTRNPLYLGSMLIAFGFALAARSQWIALALAVLFAVIYIPVIRAEEEYLRSQFAAYEEYAARVPRLIPRLRAEPAEGDSGGGFSAELYRKHREYNALMGAAAIYAALILKMCFWR